MKFELHMTCDNDDIRNFYKQEEEKRKDYEWQENVYKDAGVDLYCPRDIVIKPGESTLIKLGIKCALYYFEDDDNSDLTLKPSSYFLVPRSSISKTPLRMSNSIGIIDSGYRGEIMGAVDHIKYNESDYEVKKGQRLFQLCAPDLKPMTIKVMNYLSRTTRGSGGFGSTGH